MSIEKLKTQILEANSAYRIGNPMMSDQEFDDLCDELHKSLSDEEWTVFRSTLFETAGKVKHPWKMGSLEKIKYEEPQNVCRWINEHVENSLNVSAKVDGISCRLHYENGKLVSATTRGNGELGENITDKIFYVKGIPLEISETETTDIRGELVIFKDVFLTKYAEDFANPRNLTAGLVNKKTLVPEELQDISFVAYTVFGTKFTKKEQFEFLQKNGFNVAWHKSISIAELQVKSAVTFDRVNEELKSYVKQKLPYETDGIVLSDNDYRNENILIPENQCAFKVNDSVAETTVIDVEWGEPSKNGRMSPVAILDSVQIAGTTVNRATLNNLDFIEKMDVRYGSRVRVSKQGEIIPTIVEVIENPSTSVKITHPKECPECGAELIVDGVDLRCPNEECPSRKYAAITTFIRNLDVKHSAKKQLMVFGVDSIEAMLKFQPDPKRKSEVTFYKEIRDKVFTASKEKLFCSMPFFKNLAETQLMKIVEHYGFDVVMSKDVGKLYNFTYFASNMPSGIGPASLQAFIDGLKNAQHSTQLILDDSRYVGSSQVVKESKVAARQLGSICFTGALDTLSRSEAQRLATESGFEVKSGVSKGLTYLVIADPNSTSNKAKKARELGTKLLSEKEFLEMCKTEETDLGDL